ncbi:IS3 family transposase, partial [Lonepinella sp. BR2904]|uniref:IS3 family transposase n=1 Tax=Lonepinella sp. BR2904 TaxID=3434551 RepID=UPI003F6E2D8C
MGSLDILLDIAQLARSTFYDNLNKPDNPDKALKAKIKRIFIKNEGRYGYRRITLALREEGYVVNHKKVAKLMKELGLKGERKLKRKYQSYQGNVGKIAPNLLERNFTASKPNEKWGTDI